MVRVAWALTDEIFTSCLRRVVVFLSQQHCSSGRRRCQCPSQFAAAWFSTRSDSCRTCFDTTFWWLTTSAVVRLSRTGLTLSTYTLRWGVTSTCGCRTAFTGTRRHTERSPASFFTTSVSHGMWYCLRESVSDLIASFVRRATHRRKSLRIRYWRRQLVKDRVVSIPSGRESHLALAMDYCRPSRVINHLHIEVVSGSAEWVIGLWVLHRCLSHVINLNRFRAPSWLYARLCHAFLVDFVVL